MENNKLPSSKPVTIVQNDWHLTPEGENLFRKFFSSSSSGRRLYGVLERPALFDGIEEVTYKVVFIGRSGVGKTFTIGALAGLSGISTRSDTLGIEVTDVYWPVKIWDKVIVFKLQCWEAGDSSMKKFNHIVESCQDKVDLRVFMFSHNDSSSFAELPASMSLYASKDSDQVASIVLASKTNSKMAISPAEIKTFRLNYGVEVYSLPQSHSGKTSEELHDLITLMNTICEMLWLRDQHYIMHNSVTV